MSELSPYLYGHAMRAAGHFRDGTQASITFRHHGAIVRAASSDDSSARCDQVEALADDGPCVLAMDGLEVVVVPDLAHEDRWTDWRRQAATEGFVSVVAMPAPVAPGTDVALNLYSPVPHAWDAEAVADAAGYAEAIARAIGMRLQLSAEDAPRTPVDLDGLQVVEHALDATMRCNGCTADEALEILVSASTHRNVGLEEVAATVLLALTGVDAHPAAAGHTAPPRDVNL